MKYVQINAYSGGWAKSIIFKKHEELISQGNESWVFWARGEHAQDEHLRKIAYYPEVCFDALQTRLDGKVAFHSRHITNRLLRMLDEIDPDVVHLHVLLGYYINIEMLFTWLSNHRCQVLWTLHDCWAFTGHCIHFEYVQCEQWKSHCGKFSQCPQPDAYPETIRKGMESWSFEKKKSIFTMLPPERMRLIVPSRWLEGLVQQSFLSKYDITVQHNQIDKSIFRQIDSCFKKNNGLENKTLILSVASKWTERKGLNDVIHLSQVLDLNNYAIVAVGLNKQQIKQAPTSIIALPRTDTVDELVDIYNAADVFFNPTREDNYPTVNLEAEACGTPVITYDTGGCAETICLEQSKVVESFQQAVLTIKNIFDNCVE
ncbi:MULTISPECIES: glycosyltransferase [Collinsella]|uniref:glycosyltransferase n=1 Tax=Collinsella TaxID=102106 RepID=UPI000E510F5A|nr:MULTISPECIES: glycosyltransferase [Collinsella]RHD33320.1 glycosyltransferase [Collinsella sp. AM31-2AC]